jgi:uracil-DNA glycosylase family 4
VAIDPTLLAAYLRQQTQMYGAHQYVVRADPASVIGEHSVESPIDHATEATETIEMSMEQSTASWAATTTLTELNEQICTCMQCPLGHTRTNFVFGSGNPNADIMIVGEAPGADEDEQGLPFVGRAGQLLTKILEAISLPREEVYICNILKCRPPNNRKPLVGETDQCEPYLWKQIEIVQPKLILALGLTAANTLLKNKESMTNLRGKIHDYHGIRTLVTYHPAALLRNPEWKKYAWDDVKLLRNLYDAS